MTDSFGVSAKILRPASTPAARTKSYDDVRAGRDADDAAETGTAEGTPDPSAANTRRGLRNRKPAQQRPYYHDAQVFEDVETEPDHDLSDTPLLSRTPSPEPSVQSKPKHFKGKGRAWKKEGSDEDEEFVTPKEKKAAKAARLRAEKERARSENGKVDASEGDITSALWEALTSETPGSVKSKDKEHDQARKTNGSLSEPPKQKKKLGRPKKNSLAGDVVRDGSVDAAQSTPTQPPRRGRGRPRKSALSSELVHDDSDDDAPAAAETRPPLPKVVENPTLNDLAPSSNRTSSRPSTATSTAPASTPKKRGRPRKSDLNTTPVQQISSKAAADEDQKPVQPAPSTAADAADPKPTSTRTRPSVSSAPDTNLDAEPLPPPAAVPAAVPPATALAAAPATVPAAPPAVVPDTTDFPTPTANRGAALVESLYPRDHRVQSGSNRASSAATPVPAAATATATTNSTTHSTANPTTNSTTNSTTNPTATTNPTTTTNSTTNPPTTNTTTNLSPPPPSTSTSTSTPTMTTAAATRVTTDATKIRTAAAAIAAAAANRPHFHALAATAAALAAAAAASVEEFNALNEMSDSGSEDEDEAEDELEAMSEEEAGSEDEDEELPPVDDYPSSSPVQPGMAGGLRGMEMVREMMGEGHWNAVGEWVEGVEGAEGAPVVLGKRAREEGEEGEEKKENVKKVKEEVKEEKVGNETTAVGMGEVGTEINGEDGDGDEEGELSAAMSLSDESEL